MEFGRADRNLLVRVGKCLRDQADAIEQDHGADWASSPQAKKDHDRLRREERDLCALRRRLEAQSVPPTEVVA